MATALSKVSGFLLGVYADPRIMKNIPYLMQIVHFHEVFGGSATAGLPDSQC